MRYISIKAHPGSRKQEIIQKGVDKFEIFTKEPREENRANDDIRVQLAQFFEVPVQKINLIRGRNQANKIFTIYDAS